MTPTLTALSMTVAGTAALVFMGLGLRSLARRRTAIDSSGKDPEPQREVQRGHLGRLGAMLRPKDDRALEQLSKRLVRAGLYSRDQLDLYLSARLCVILGGLLLFIFGVQLVEGLVLSVLLFLGIACASILGPSVWLDLRSSKRQQEISQSLPPTIDLLVTCLDAGLNLEQALTRVAVDHGDDLLAGELRIALEEIRAGLSTTAAFRRMAERLGHEELQNLSTLIAQATSLGGNIGDALRAHGDTMRKQRIVFLEERAGKANAKLTLPLTLCLLPAVMALLLGPAALMIARTVF